MFSTIGMFFNICNELGVPIEPSKTVLPTHVCEFNGILFNARDQTASIPSSKVAELNSLLLSTSQQSYISASQLRSLLGKIAFVMKVVRSSRVFARRLFQYLHSIAATGEVHRMPDFVRDDLQTWLDLINKWNGVSLLCSFSFMKTPVYTDASFMGFGACWGHHWLYGSWPSFVKDAAEQLGDFSTTFIELYAVVIAASTWSHMWKGKRIRFNIDNQGVVHSILRFNSGSTSCAALLKQLFVMASKCGFDLGAFYIPTDKNPADSLSRLDVQSYRSINSSCNQEPCLAIIPPLVV